MMDSKKSTYSATATATAVLGGDSLLERLPESILNEILFRLEPPETLTTLCSLACVSRTLNSSLNKTLSSISSVDLSTRILDSRTFDGIIRRLGKIKKITVDCYRLKNSSIRSFLTPNVEELTLLKWCSLSNRILTIIGKTCPNLRVLTLEFSALTSEASISIYDLKLEPLFANCRFLESLQIKVRGGEVNLYGFMLNGIYDLLPQTLKILKLQPVTALDTHVYLSSLNNTDPRIPISPKGFGQTLTQLSLVLDNITDVVLHTISHTLTLLAELNLKDQPRSEPSDDLSDLGIQSLVGCKHLISLSIVRTRLNFTTTFKKVTDMGMFLLSEGCKKLESIRLNGFSKVSDAGFTSILNSCTNLKKFDIQNATLLSDLTFQDVSKLRKSLLEVKLVSCSFITSESIRELANCSGLEALNLLGCRSVADSCLENVSCLRFLTTLNLGGADVTDNGMLILGQGNAPISVLSLRGCKRVTDKGIGFLLKKEGKLRESLTSLDIGHMGGITDDAITTIVECALGIVELCIRNCFHVTDESVKALGLKGEKGKMIKRLDLSNCTALTDECVRLLAKPFFRGLQWLGIGHTRIAFGRFALIDIVFNRRWLTLCICGCEIGCHDGWPYYAMSD